MLNPTTAGRAARVRRPGHDRGRGRGARLHAVGGSQQLSQLQREAGVELFRKAGRRLELTDAGRTLVERAGELLARVEEVEAELAAQAGEVRGTVARGRVPDRRGRARHAGARGPRRAHPALRVELVEAEAEESLPLLARGAIDVVIAEEYEHAPRPRLPGLRRDYLEPDEMLLALPGPDVDGPVALAGLAGSTWATARAGTAYADMFDRLCRSVGGFEPDVRYRVNDLQLLLALVAAGRAAAIVPALGQPEGVTVRPIAEGRFSRALFVATRASDHARPSTAAVVAAIRTVSMRTSTGPGDVPIHTV